MRTELSREVNWANHPNWTVLASRYPITLIILRGVPGQVPAIKTGPHLFY